MNISSDELNALGVSGLSADATLQSRLASQLWSVVVLQRTGDTLHDPFRTVTSFATKASAVTYGSALKFTDTQDVVALYNGATLDSIISGDARLVAMYCARASVAHPAPTTAEVSDVSVQAVKPKPAALAKAPVASRTHK